MTADELAVAVERAVDSIDRTARDNGHDPHTWSRPDAAAAHTACRACGATAAVRVRAGGTWQAGSLRFSQCPSAPPTGERG